MFFSLIRLVLLVALNLIVVAGVVFLGAYLVVAPDLPDVSNIHETDMQVPLRVYSSSGDLLSSFGEQRRRPLKIAQVPKQFSNAFLAAEDARFYEHPGVDYQGLARAALLLARTGEKQQGGSTITMQLARNVFLSPERTYVRKLREIALAFKIEQAYTKDEILELYLNKIYFGQRSYGIGAAADTYYGVDINDLRVDQMALIAGLPKAPSTYNPIVNPSGAKLRRDYVLKRMLDLGQIDAAAYETALKAPIDASEHATTYELDAPFIGEMARAEMTAKYGNDAYKLGLKVYTTVKTDLQRAADQALRNALLAYDKRHGYRGPEKRTNRKSLSREAADEVLEQHPTYGELRAALVVGLSGQQATVYLGLGERITLNWDAMAQARNSNAKSASDVFQVGDVIRLKQDSKKNWAVSQLPKVAGALVSISPDDGRILALSGGFDFYQSKFNRATQAQRQPGSAFKPFIYSAALQWGLTPASVINDAPLVINDESLEGLWRPENDSKKFFGPTRLREALYRSRNLVSIRVLNTIGIDYALDHIRKFGFDTRKHPRALSLALGSGLVTPLELAAGYAAFANSGYLIKPYFIDRVEDASGKILFRANPVLACASPCPGIPDKGPNPHYATRIIPATNAYLMTSMLEDVVRRGTAAKASAMGRDDIAGKTGTTNDLQDAWFSGFNGDIVTTVWVGFDQQRSLGGAEAGSVAALPMWMEYMGTALKGKPSARARQPEGIVRIQIDPKTGKRATANTEGAISEAFPSDHVPEEAVFTDIQPPTIDNSGAPIEIPEQLF